jgi:Tfp pilus assembly protein FimT
MRALRPARSAMTLVELLVVVMIMVILLGIALPLVRPNLEDRKIREASRQLNAFIRVAQSRAAATNAPYGVWIARTDDDRDIAYQVYFAQTPLPYSGETTGATAAIHPSPTTGQPFALTGGVANASGIVEYFNANGNFTRWEAVIALGAPCSAGLDVDPDPATESRLVNVGDVIQLNHSGPEYRIREIAYDGSTYETYLLIESPPSDIHARQRENSPSHLSGKPVPYKIRRQPRRLTAGSLSLPNETAIVLSLSGIEGVEFADYSTNPADSPALTRPPVALMFRPDGSVDRVYHYANTDSTWFGRLPDGPIHFLIGRSILADDQTDLAEQNLNDGSNLWVSVGHRTGAITTAPTAGFLTTVIPSVANVNDARSYARKAESVGGN